MAKERTSGAVEALSAELVRTLIDALPQSICYLDRGLRLLLCNKAHAEWFGAPVDAGNVPSLTDTVGAEVYRSLVPYIGRVLGGETVRFEATLPDRFARTRPADISFLPHVAAGGEVTGFLAVASDLSPHHDYEQDLKDSAERLRAVLATTPDGIVTIDGAGIVDSFSPGAERLFGYGADEIVGHNVSMLMPAPDSEAHDRYIARYLETGEKRIIGIGRQVTAQRKDGSTFPMKLAVDEVKLRGARMFTGVIHDLSEEVAREEELVQARKMEAVGQLTGGVAHDFNNLLTVIVGNLEMLEMQLGDNAPAQQSLEQAQEAAELGGQLTARLLAFARRQPLEPKLVNLNDLVSDMSDLLRRSLGEAVQIATALADDLRQTLVDPGQLQNALLNLCINARDAMPEGGELTIRTANVVLAPRDAAAQVDVVPGAYVLLSVADTGTGIAPEILPRVVEPFFTTKVEGSGSGLGLSSIYGFAKQSGGHLQIASKPATGTTVSLYLPQFAVEESAAAAGLGAAPDVESHGETVLVVEDDHRVRATTVARVEALGYRVLEAGDAHAALELLQGGDRVDLLFTDVVMSGGMNGRELADAARRLRPDLKLLYTSGYTAEAGIDDDTAALLRKPYRNAELADKLRRALDT